jgi:putative membrane protein insertion efficiency factor
MIGPESDRLMSDTSNVQVSRTQRVLVALIGAYRRAISPLLPSACRFHPTCSAYAAEAIMMHGAVRGIALAATRLLRCHPWCEGGIDPVPSRCEAHTHPVTAKGRA